MFRGLGEISSLCQYDIGQVISMLTEDVNIFPLDLIGIKVCSLYRNSVLQALWLIWEILRPMCLFFRLAVFLS